MSIFYVAVYWENERKFTVQSVSCVKDKRMLKNPKMVCDIEHMGKEKDKDDRARIIAKGGL